MSGTRPRAVVSVRELIWFLLRQGDLERRGGDPEALAAGARAHALELRPKVPGYEPEVSLKLTVPGRPDVLVVGRADAVIAGDPVVLEEIKSTSTPLAEILGLREEDPAVGHPAVGDPGGRRLDWAQAICYAAMLGEIRALPRLEVRLRYVSSAGDGEEVLRRVYPHPVLRAFLGELCRRYGVWVARAEEWVRLRDSSLSGLEPPFDSLRPGQAELMEAVTGALVRRERLFVRAPTGMGKTAAVLAASLRSLAELGLERVFYLTPRGTTATAPLRELERLRARGLRLRSIVLAAREKTCFHPGTGCSPAFCPVARGHNDRILGALEDILREERIEAATVRRYARAHRVCPHELGLDASVWCDLIIGDYNYVFDPRVALRRFQDPAGRPREQVYLIDEAHNLLDRSREMYSAAIASGELEELERSVEAGRPALARAARALASSMELVAEECDELDGSDPPAGAMAAPPRVLVTALEELASEGEAWLADGESSMDETVAGRVFDILFFRATYRRFDSRFATMVRAAPGGLELKLCCLDPSALLAERLDQARASVFFSGTLEPLGFYASVLGGGEWAATLSLASPFARENLCAAVEASISTRYRLRAASVGRLARLVAGVARVRAGSYIAFLPSFEYLGGVSEAFAAASPDIEQLVQRPSMSEPERADFLAAVGAPSAAGRSRVAFAVMGGLFGEAVDLPGEALLGVIIVGPGLPPPGAERELQRAYWEERTGQGFEYAFLYPGWSRVLQAAGRVIRTESDRGVVLLVDPRFAESGYRELFPREWEPLPVLRGQREVERELRRFWSAERAV